MNIINFILISHLTQFDVYFWLETFLIIEAQNGWKIEENAIYLPAKVQQDDLNLVGNLADPLYIDWFSIITHFNIFCSRKLINLPSWFKHGRQYCKIMAILLIFGCKTFSAIFVLFCTGMSEFHDLYIIL